MNPNNGPYNVKSGNFVLKAICPEEAFQLVLRVINSLCYGTKESVKELHSDIMKYTIKFMSEHGYESLDWFTDNKERHVLHIDGTISKNNLSGLDILSDATREITDDKISSVKPDKPKRKYTKRKGTKSKAKKVNKKQKVDYNKINTDEPFNPYEKIDLLITPKGRIMFKQQSNKVLLSFMRDIQIATRKEVAEKYRFAINNFQRTYESISYELIERGLGDFVFEPMDTPKRRKRKVVIK